MTKELQDPAWNSLSGEFKEVVKNYYQYALKHYQTSSLQQNIANTLEHFFGTDNLTSDAEGEEVLTVPRSKVQKIFAGQTEVQKNTPCEAILHYEAAAKTELLYTLFGSKCLPDEKVSDSTPLQEPKPAEPKFSKGDMVHCKSFGYEGDYKVLEYTGGPRNCYDCIDKYGSYYRFYESDLEPYTEP